MILLKQDLDLFRASHLTPMTLPAKDNTHLLLAAVMTRIVKKNDEYYKKKVSPIIQTHHLNLFVLCFVFQKTKQSQLD